jgi:hypothetical protein
MHTLHVFLIVITITLLYLLYLFLVSFFKGEGEGRLGNKIIRNIAISFIASKHNIKVKYDSKQECDKLGLLLFNGKRSFKKVVNLTDSNYFSIYNAHSINHGINGNKDFFQSKEIINKIYTFLHTEPIKSNIIKNNPFKNRYNSNSDIFVHVRLTDASKFNPGYDYYQNTINKITYENLYISTDDKSHPIITKLLASNPNSSLIEYDEIETFQFASTNSNIILSNGSFSSIIGYLSFFSKVYYPARNTIWHGDLFSIPGWIECSLDNL